MVYTNGVGPPGVSGVDPGCPTTSGVVLAAAAVDWDVLVVAIGEVVAAAAAVVDTDVVPGPRVCLHFTR